MIEPYYASALVELYLGDCRDVLPTLGRTFDATVCDPPYGSTPLAWDRWPTGWTQAVAETTSSMWCFGSLRVFMVRTDEFAQAGWRLSHDSVWEKNTGSGFQTDRLRCVHEQMAHFYRGRWDEIYHKVPRVPSQQPHQGRAVRQRGSSVHTNGITSGGWVEDGTRMQRSVIYAPSMRGRAIHPTEKPVPVLTPLIEYAVASGGVVLDPMAGSCSTAVAAGLIGRRAVCIEADEAMCERAAQRLGSVCATDV